MEAQISNRRTKRWLSREPLVMKVEADVLMNTLAKKRGKQWQKKREEKSLRRELKLQKKKIAQGSTQERRVLEERRLKSEKRAEN